MLQGLRGAQEGQLPANSPTRRWIRAIGLAVAVGVAYFLAARLSLFLLTKPDGVAVFWPAAGIAAGVLIALGRDARWPVAVGTMVATIVANLTGDRTVWSALVFALCNAGEALLAAWLIERYFGLEFQPRQAASRAGATGGSGRRDRRLGDRRHGGIQVVPQSRGAGLDSPGSTGSHPMRSALSRLRRC